MGGPLHFASSSSCSSSSSFIIIVIFVIIKLSNSDRVNRIHHDDDMYFENVVDVTSSTGAGAGGGANHHGTLKINGVPDEDVPATHQKEGCRTATLDDGKKLLLESVGEYFIGETFVTNVRQYYEKLTRSEVEEELNRAKEELESTSDELSKAYTQLLILRRRQADLGAYIEESLKKPREQRNPTVEELVLTEDDRLALLDNRFKRIINKLKKQKLDLEKYIALHGGEYGENSIYTIIYKR